MISSDNGLVTSRRQANIWTNDGLVYWRMYASLGLNDLIHLGWGKCICVGNLNIIGLDNGLSPGRRQAIIWSNAGKLLIWPLGTNFGKILRTFMHFHSRKCIWKWRLQFNLGLGVLSMGRVSSIPWLFDVVRLIQSLDILNLILKYILSCSS